MLPVLLSVALALWARPAAAQTFAWDALEKNGQTVAGTVRSADTRTPFSTLQITGPGQPRTVTILTIDAPRITGSRYAITGQVRYEGVEGAGCLEMWSHFPGGGQYFSRTLAETGPMMKLQGTSGWRSFTLPFDATGAASAPSRLVVNVVLPGRGVVTLGPLSLASQDGADEMRAWWPDRTGGWIGAVAGSAVGALGAMIGVLTSLGRARRVVTAAATGLVVVGIAAFLTGIVALTWSQSYAVYYPLLLCGFLSTVIPLGLLPTIRRRYEAVELRAMRAQDLR
jgi:hypothetical protein